MKKSAKKGLRKGRGSRNTLKIEDIEAVFAERKPGAEGNFKFFSVLVPLVEKEDDLYLLYEVRAKNMERQPGEICFRENWSLSRLQRNALCIDLGGNRYTARSRSRDHAAADNIPIISLCTVIWGDPEAACWSICTSAKMKWTRCFLVALNDLLAVTWRSSHSGCSSRSRRISYDKVYGENPIRGAAARAMPIYEVDEIA